MMKEKCLSVFGGRCPRRPAGCVVLLSSVTHDTNQLLVRLFVSSVVLRSEPRSIFTQ